MPEKIVQLNEKVIKGLQPQGSHQCVQDLMYFSIWIR